MCNMASTDAFELAKEIQHVTLQYNELVLD